MAVSRVAPEVIRFYQSTISEAERLTSSADGMLELLRTQELLRRFLPAAPVRVLDVGGGPGTHARWLLADGYEVRLIDPVPRHVEQAGRIPGCEAGLGDACRLDVADGSYDVVLLLGPLYHLPEAEDRRRALSEALRVLRPGGLLAAAGINRYASLFEHTALAHLHRDGVRRSVADVLATQVHDGKRAFTTAYFHTGRDLAQEIAEAGFRDAEVFGVEGPAWGMLKATELHTGAGVADTPLFEAALTAARMAEPYPELLAANSHLLAFGRKPTPTG
ncbi:class I SAM-dependent methyltransferase [Streptomyces profundus]|uniref:class I SAM-dependent methyltransferase n=1 Tax=Streptomyces profundus TaxID=2867410 RepID=UPI001D1616FD|nr:class I SAM-dependent methyltransferase [Streptomyces sp. MA3_2.13]UED84084.1 class I SAM-dependent methyltransferase [Streptomyces sp. MA3_2.13]